MVMSMIMVAPVVIAGVHMRPISKGRMSARSSSMNRKEADALGDGAR